MGGGGGKGRSKNICTLMNAINMIVNVTTLTNLNIVSTLTESANIYDCSHITYLTNSVNQISCWEACGTPSWSRNFSPFMEPVYLLTVVLTTFRNWPLSAARWMQAILSLFLEIHFNVMLPFTITSSDYVFSTCTLWKEAKKKELCSDTADKFRSLIMYIICS
jgi:hypothetical protein